MQCKVTDCTILMIDDEEANLDLLESILGMEGYDSLVRTSDSRTATTLFESCSPDLVLLDLHMPHRNGFEILQELRTRIAPEDYLPVLVLTADITPAAKERALSGGARDFLTKPFDMVEVLLRVRNLLEARLLHQLQREARARAEAAARRSSLLAEASRILASSLDSSTTLSRLSRLLVPDQVDACTLLLRKGERFVPAGIIQIEASAEACCRALLIQEEFASAVSTALQQGEVVKIPCRQGEPGEQNACALVAPMRVQSRAIGGLVLIRVGETDYPREDVELAEELAARATLAVENARLFAEAELATRARDRMLSVVAHDLRNPLAVVSMYAEMLLSLSARDEDEYEQKALLGISDTAARMQRLIEDLLDVSRSQHGTLTVVRTTRSVEELFLQADAMLRPLVAPSPVDLVVLADAVTGSHPIQIDASRFLQVLSNLVGNALKFTPPGGRIIVAASPADGHLHVTVEDTGCGIPADQLPHIFSAFWQSREDDRRGIGLGLWICRTIVEAHEGRIWVESTGGVGTTFHLTFPWPATQAPADIGSDQLMGQLTHSPATLMS